jgi:hypothetical protein
MWEFFQFEISEACKNAIQEEPEDPEPLFDLRG